MWPDTIGESPNRHLGNSAAYGTEHKTQRSPDGDD